MSKGKKKSKSSVKDDETPGKPRKLAKVVIMVPGDSYLFTPEGYDVGFYLLPLSWVTIRRVMSEISIELGFSLDKVENPDPSTKASRPFVMAETDENKLFSQLLALRLSKLSVVGWDERVIDENDESVKFNAELFEYVTDPLILDHLCGEIMGYASTALNLEKKS